MEARRDRAAQSPHFIRQAAAALRWAGVRSASPGWVSWHAAGGAAQQAAFARCARRDIARLALLPQPRTFTASPASTSGVRSKALSGLSPLPGESVMLGEGRAERDQNDKLPI